LNGVLDAVFTFSGEAGQGVQTVELILPRILKRAGFHVFANKEYMSRVRGGVNSSSIRVSSEPVRAQLRRMDFLIPLNRGLNPRIRSRLSGRTVVICDESYADDYRSLGVAEVLALPMERRAREIGDLVFLNVLSIGLSCALLGVEEELGVSAIASRFADKGDEVLSKNSSAFRAGFEMGSSLRDRFSGRLPRPSLRSNEGVLASGTEMVALGCVAGGCDFIAAYPMSPSTGVFTFMCQNAHRFGVIAEQAEDEIAAMNMAIGAWLAGGRGMVTTSGGGFALMEEALSLAAMTETPVVVHLAQRPAPATGLPTRTEQADLNLALYAGHGEFPRVIYAPGSLEEAFYLSKKAFEVSDRFQVPAFVLTDQYLVDLSYDFPGVEVGEVPELQVVRSEPGYKRFLMTESGVSPRAVPGYGEGLFVVTADEHTEEGHITEDPDIRSAMVEKRLRKGELLEGAFVPPKVEGRGKRAVVCWGSTYHIAKEALSRLGRDDLVLVHFSQVWPLPRSACELISSFEEAVVVENNATGQLANLLQQVCCRPFERRVLRYSGDQFTVEELVERLEEAF